MLKGYLLFILLFNFFFAYSQNGVSLNNTLNLLDTVSSPKWNTYHPEVVSFYDNESAEINFSGVNNLKLYPLFTVQTYVPIKNNFIFNTLEGARMAYNFRDKLKLNVACSHEMYLYPENISDRTDSLKYIPNHGNYYTKTGDIFHWINFTGNINYAPYKYLQFEVGNDKHFLGNGYRSLFLSDYSGAYPYFAINLKVWNIHYLSMTSMMRDYYKNEGLQIEYRPKYSTIHFISWNIHPLINVNLFEAIVWRSADSALYNGVNINYLNPVVFMRPVEYSLGSTDNALVGAGLNLNLFKNLKFYSQFVLDEFFIREITNRGYRDNKIGYQLGMKGRASPKANLSWLIEQNLVRPFTYSHYNTLQTYGNLRQPLAHPLGANFKEYVARVSLTKQRKYCILHVNYARYGKDGNGELHGNNIYTNYWDVDRFGHFLLNGIKTTRYSARLTLGYLIKPGWNMVLETGILWQKEVTSVDPVNYNYFFLRLKTLFYNDQWFDQ